MPGGACGLPTTRFDHSLGRGTPVAAGSANAATAGFTLLEMVVVLSILGLVTALTAPAMLRGIDSWQRKAQFDALVEQVRGLPARARLDGRALRIDDALLASDATPLKAEAGWELVVVTPWTVRPNGVCDPGALDIGSVGGRTSRVRVDAPFCEPVLAEELAP